MLTSETPNRRNSSVHADGGLIDPEYRFLATCVLAAVNVITNHLEYNKESRWEAHLSFQAAWA